MAKVSHVLIPAGLEESFGKCLKSPDRFVHSRVCRFKKFVSRKQKKQLLEQSLFTALAVYWKEMTNEEKSAWKDAGDVIGLTNWQNFIHDIAARWAHGVAGIGTPKTSHQGRVGCLKIEAPDDYLKIKQLHPRHYFVRRRIPGKWTYEPVAVDELFELPLTISLSFNSDLEACGPDPSVRYFARVWHSYQGVDKETDLCLNMPAQSSGWQNMSETLTSVIGQVISYTLYIEIKDLRGVLYFDNIKAEHSLHNWARDPRCNEIDRVFPLSWHQIPKRWVAVEVGPNSSYSSTYKD